MQKRFCNCKMEKLGFIFKSLNVMEQNKDICKRETSFLIPLLPSKENGSQGARPLLNRDHRCKEVNWGPYTAQGPRGECLAIQEAEQARPAMPEGGSMGGEMDDQLVGQELAVDRDAQWRSGRSEMLCSV